LGGNESRPRGSAFSIRAQCPAAAQSQATKSGTDPAADTKPPALPRLPSALGGETPTALGLRVGDNRIVIALLLE